MSNFYDNLALLFIALKLMGYIDWNWFLVLSPIIFAGICGISVAAWPHYKKLRSQQRWRDLKEKYKED